MRSTLKCTRVLELKLPGVPNEFNAADLERVAEKVISDLSALVDAKSLLQHTELAHHLECAVDELGRAYLKLVVSLQPNAQMLLDISYRSSTPGQFEEDALADRERLSKAFHVLQTRAAQASVELAQRVSAVCLNQPVDRQLLSEELRAIMSVRHRRFKGSVVDEAWQLELPTMSKYVWRNGFYKVRVRLARQANGFKLRLLPSSELAPELRAARSLKMPYRPEDDLSRNELEDAEWRSAAVDLIVRVGSVAGSDVLKVADFVALNAK